MLFCPRHWETIPSPAQFSDAHALAGSLITLPCDQRYDIDAMHALAKAVRESLAALGSG